MTDYSSNDFPQDIHICPIPQAVNMPVLEAFNDADFLNSVKASEVSIGHLYQRKGSLVLDELGAPRNFYGSPDDDMMIQVNVRMTREDFLNHGGTEIEKLVKSFKNAEKDAELNMEINPLALHKALTKTVLIKSIEHYFINYADRSLANRIFIDPLNEKLDIIGFNTEITFEELRGCIISMAAVLGYMVKDLNHSEIEESLDLIAKMINSIVTLKTSLNR